MERDFFKYLPSEIITNILSRPTVRTIAICKCVCKSWLDLLQTDDFVNSHLSRSAAAGLAVSMREGNSSRCTVFELDDEIDVESSHDHQLTHLAEFNFPHRVKIEGSANGMLFLLKREICFDTLYVYNPISREYIAIDCPEEIFITRGVVYGFGGSKITGQHKVVCIRRDLDCDICDCHVYTLGTGSWRRVEPADASYDFGFSAVFLNGNLHWLVSDSNAVFWISVFDLETERFSAFAVPPLQGCVDEDCTGFSAVGGRLWLYNHTSEDEKVMIVIWLMKEYGDKRSWTKEYVISLHSDFDGYRHVPVYLVKVFEDGGVLMVCDERLLCYYCNKTETTRAIGVFDKRHVYGGLMLLTPNFLSLKRWFPMENVISL